MILTTICLLCAAMCAAGPANLITNEGFENGLQGWQTGFGAEPQLDAVERHSGSAAAKISVEGETSALDADAFTVGYDIDPQTTYRVSAWIKSGGVQKGGFGGRVYCYDAAGKYLAMHTFGTLNTGAPAGDWVRSTLELKPGGAFAMPPDTDRVLLRFSIWAEDGDCTGKVWIDDVQFVPVEGEGPGAPPQWLNTSDQGTAIVLKDDLPVAGVASAPDKIGEMLRKQGYTVNFVDGATLAQPEVMNPRWVDLVVLPYGGTFPADARDALVKYANHGGSLLTLGGLAFSRFVRKVDGEWLDVTTTTTEAESAASIADNEDGDATRWDLKHRGTDDSVTVSVAGPGANGTGKALRVSYGLTGFGYVGLEDTAAPDADHSAFCFWAKGSQETSQLAIELRETDQSRWKKVIALTEDWRFYAIDAKQFMSYASEGRGEAGDFVHAEKAVGAWFGLTAGMVGKGEREVWLDEIQWRRTVAGGGLPPAPIRPVEDADLTLAAFGPSIPQASTPVATTPIFSPVARFEGAAELRLAAPGTSMKAVGRGSFSGFVANAPRLAPRAADGRGIRLGGRPAGRLIPLLSAHDEEGNNVGDAAAMYLPDRPGARGAVWAFFGVENADAADLEGFEILIKHVGDIARGGATIANASLVFEVIDEEATCILEVDVVGGEAGNLTLAAAVRKAEGGLQPTVTQPAEPGRVRIPLPDVVPTDRKYSVEVGLVSGDTPVSFERIDVDVESCFLALANWLVDNQREDGTFSGTSFEDNRGVRGLLGAYEITGQDRFRKAAVRWGEEMIRLQREDGGYRMGYGITSKGEACYVADGGEIAIAMARLVSYTQGAQRQRLIDSLKAYFGYRESFREENGAIGVGWCLHDYGQRPVAPLDKPTRIYAGEQNTYTIGCSLAAAAAYSQITQSQDDLAMALRDTNWLLEHYASYSGAAAESAFWAYTFVADGELKARLIEDLTTGFRERVIRPEDTSWLSGGGRSVLDLDPIAWWLHEVDPDDAYMQAAFGRWAYALCGSNSTSAVRHLLGAETLSHDEKRFIDFAAVALADAVSPMISLKAF